MKDEQAKRIMESEQRQKNMSRAMEMAIDPMKGKKINEDPDLPKRHLHKKNDNGERNPS